MVGSGQNGSGGYSEGQVTRGLWVYTRYMFILELNDSRQKPKKS